MKTLLIFRFCVCVCVFFSQRAVALELCAADAVLHGLCEGRRRHLCDRSEREVGAVEDRVVLRRQLPLLLTHLSLCAADHRRRWTVAWHAKIASDASGWLARHLVGQINVVSGLVAAFLSICASM